MTEQSLPEESIFLQALEIPCAADRSAYLSRACGENLRLRAEVESLLRANRNGGDFLDLPDAPALAKTLGPPAGDRPVYEGAGCQIGPYKLLEQIGEGGFGVVFMAEQQHPVRRKVALKVLKPGMDTRQVIARFEAERQALALMDHPHIAKVLDAGATESGRPYFVMELVKGVLITEYCDQHQLTPKQRLELFVTVCQAVQHAHQKGIIHRDIKPGNVLVTLHDDKPVVKVIDFGIAKATIGQLTDKTLYTGFAQLIGTPLYMSPEQASMNGLDVDTRSDVYSLGVLLYELLTGTTPFDKERLAKAAYDEIRQIIREEEPPRPSARISTLRNADTAPAARSGNWKEPASVVLGELDWIVMKALEKDRNRRYESAGALARDVERHLRHEPVLACPPSNWYRFRKLARRNRTACVAATVAALVVVLGTAALAVSNYLIRQEQARTRYEQQRTEKARILAEKHADEVRQGLERLKQANELLDRGRWHWSAKRWDDAHAAFTQALELRSDHVSVRLERAEMLAHLGLWDLASADLARSFEDWTPDRTVRWYQHALLRAYLGDNEDCRGVWRRMQARFDGVATEENVGEIVRAGVLAPDETVDCGRLVQLAERGAANTPTNWYSLYLLGTARYRDRQYEPAVTALRESLQGWPDWSGRALSYPILAMALHQLGRSGEAAEALRSAAEALDRWTQARCRAWDDNIPWVDHQGATAEWPIAWWDWVECHLYFREACGLIEGRPPADDARLHILRARSLSGLRRQSKAVPEYEIALQLLPHDPGVRMEAHRCRGYLAEHRGEWHDAAREFGSAARLVPNESHLWRFEAVAHLAAGDIDAYRPCCAAMLERFQDTSDTVIAENVVLACVMGEAAVSNWAGLLAVSRTAEPKYYSGKIFRGAALYRAGDYAGAIDCFTQSGQLYHRTAWEWSFLAMAHQRLGQTDEAQRCVAEAARWIEAADRGSAELADQGWTEWYQPVVYPRLLREAKDLLRR
jgi:serine/threonine protein kinase/Flp pilus assembly protein TadD